MKLETSQYSERLGLLQPEQLQAALTHFTLGELVATEPIPFGLFGQNLFLSSTTGAYVLRGAPHYPWQFPAERFYARLLHEHTTVPVPWPYLLEDRPDIFGWPFVIMPRMPGLQLADRTLVAGLGHPDRVGIARALGETLAATQTLIWPVSGRYDLAIDDVAAFPDGFRGEVLSGIEACLTQAAGYNDRTTAEDHAWVHDVIHAAGDALSEPFEPCFVLKDHKEHNATVERDRGGWRVRGVFDLMEGGFGDGELALCRQLCLYLEENVELAHVYVHAYLAKRPARPGVAKRLPVYLLRERLSVWEYCQRPGFQREWDPRLTFREWASPYLGASQALITCRCVEPSTVTL